MDRWCPIIENFHRSACCVDTQITCTKLSLLAMIVSAAFFQNFFLFLPNFQNSLGQKALADAGIPYSAVEQACVGYVYGEYHPVLEICA